MQYFSIQTKDDVEMICSAHSFPILWWEIPLGECRICVLKGTSKGLPLNLVLKNSVELEVPFSEVPADQIELQPPNSPTSSREIGLSRCFLKGVAELFCHLVTDSIYPFPLDECISRNSSSRTLIFKRGSWQISGHRDQNPQRIFSTQS